MKSKSELLFCAVKFPLFFVLCIFTVSANALDQNIATVAPLTADQPASNEKIGNHNNNLKKLEKIRFHDPTPEYYKGPSTNNYDSYDVRFNGQSQHPTNFVSGNYYNPYLSKEHLSKHGFYGPISQKDRVSIGGGYYSGSDFNGNGYSGSDRGVRPYGSPQPVDIPGNGYNSNGWYNGGGGVAFGGGGAPYGGGYDGAYDQGYDGNIWSDKMHYLSKSHLLPLAGAALIGIAAALLVNPVLLQLGTISGKRRRRRDTLRQSLPLSTAHNLAYRGQFQQ